MALDDEVRKIAPGANPFEWAAGACNNLYKDMAEKSLFARDLVIRVMNSEKYRVNEYVSKSQVKWRRQFTDLGVNPSDIIKKKERNMVRLYLTEQGVLSLFRIYQDKGYVRPFNEKEVLSDVRAAAGIIKI